METITDMEKVAIVAMLCTPSELHLAWNRPDSPGSDGLTVDAVLDALGLSQPGKDRARRIMTEADKSGARAHFAAVVNLVKANFWPGEEPHPSAPVARKIVETLRGAQVT